MTRIESRPSEETIHDAARRVTLLAAQRKIPVILCRCSTEVIVDPRATPEAIVDSYFDAQRSGTHAPDSSVRRFCALVAAVCRHFHKTEADVRIDEWTDTEVAGEVVRAGMGGPEWHSFRLGPEQLSPP